MKKIMTILGARPQFIKAAAVSNEIRACQQLQEIIVHTGQHYDDNMSKIFFDELGIPEINHHLGIGSGSQGVQTGEMLAVIESVILKEKPDCVLVYGDTNSTLAGALAAVKCHIPIAHVEAGLRSYNRKMPEEINRIVTDQLSEMLFTPTTQAIENLRKEGFSESKMMNVGDVMYDAALFFSNQSEKNNNILNQLHLEKEQYILATIHRAENTDNIHKLGTIFTALDRISKKYRIVMPLHPRTRKSITQLNKDFLTKTDITIIEPVGFFDMIALEKNAQLIITDSGGIQKEAYFYQIPCVTLRDETEWIETVSLEWNQLIKIDNADTIYQQVLQSIGKKGILNQHPYGKGNAAAQIVERLCEGEF